MSKLFFLLFIIIVGTTQTNAQIDKKQLPALKDSILRYYQTDKNTGDPVNEFIMTFAYFFNNGNQALATAVKEEELRTRLSHRKTVEMFYDSLYHYLLTEVLPAEINAADEGIRTYSSLTTQFFCDCFKQHSKTEIKEENFGSLIQQCTGIMENDTILIPKVQQIVASGKLADQELVIKINGLSLVANCKLVADYFYNTIRTIYLEMYIQNGEKSIFQIVDKLNALFPEEKKLVPKIFPAYKTFTKEIAKTNALANTEKSEERVVATDNEDGSVTIIKTFYKKNKKQVILLGQAEYTLNKRSPSAIVLSCKYIAPETIKNAADIIKSIEDTDLIPPPPPAMEEFKRLDIDIKKGDK